MENLDSLFEFKIGQRVCWRQHLLTIEKDLEYLRMRGAVGLQVGLPSPRVGTVVERMIQECHGGVQRHYLVSGIDGPEDGSYRKLTSMEICDATELEKRYEACRDALVQNARDRVAAEAEIRDINRETLEALRRVPR